MKLAVKVLPKSSQMKAAKQPDGSFRVYVNAPPEKGKANKQVLEVLAKHLKIPQSRLKITIGHQTSHKIIEII